MTKVIPSGVVLEPGEGGKYHLLYMIRNDISGLEYFGVHSAPQLFDWYCGGGTRLRNAVLKHGHASFTMFYLASFPTKADSLNAEKLVVDVEFVRSGCSYNLVSGGGGEPWMVGKTARDRMASAQRGRKHSDATKAKMSAASLGKPKNKGAVVKSAMFKLGTKHKPETIERIRASTKGRIISDLTKTRMSVARREWWANRNRIKESAAI
jgi:hypothetical protein